MADVPVNLLETRGRLALPGTAPPRAEPKAPPVTTAAPPDPAADPKGTTPKGTAPEGTDPQPGPETTTACRLCHWPHALDPTEPDPGDAQEFRNAVFEGRLFEKVFTLFGSASVVLRDLSTDEETAAQQVALRESRVTPFVNGNEAIGRLSELRLAFALTRAKVADRTYVAPAVTNPYEADLDALHKALRTWCGSDTVYRAVRMHYSRLHMILTALMARAAEKSFFAATGSGGVSPASPPRT